MVIRLCSKTVEKAIVQCVTAAMPTAKYYATANPTFLARKWKSLMDLGLAKSYALNQNRGILLGMIVPDLLTGVNQGIVYLWLAQASGSIALLRAFEADCKSENVSMIIAGSSAFWDMDRRERLYRALKYNPYGKSFFKTL